MALAVGVAGLSALVACSRPQLPAEPLRWRLQVGPQRGDQPVVCASDTQAPCAIPRGTGEQRIQATMTVVLPGTANHRFTGEVLMGFVGDDIGPAAHALLVDQPTAPGTAADVTAIGLVTFKPGSYPIRVRLEETGADLTPPRQHTIDVMVQVR